MNDGTLLLNGGIVAISDILNIGDGIGAPGSAAVVATSGTRQFPFDVNVTIRSDGVLNDQDSNEHINALTMTGGSVIGTGVLVFGGAAVTTQSSPMTAAISVTTIYLNGPNQRFTVGQGTTASGVDLDVSSQLLDTMGGSSTVIKAGAGTMRLTGNNMFSGGVTLNAGTLIIGNNTALGTGTLTAGGGASGRHQWSVHRKQCCQPVEHAHRVRQWQLHLDRSDQRERRTDEDRFRSVDAFRYREFLRPDQHQRRHAGDGHVPGKRHHELGHVRL